MQVTSESFNNRRWGFTGGLPVALHVFGQKMAPVCSERFETLKHAKILYTIQIKTDST